MKYKLQFVLALIALVLFLVMTLSCACKSQNTEIIVIQETPSPTYFGPATISPPAFQLFGIPTRPLRELGGWRVNYGI